VIAPRVTICVFAPSEGAASPFSEALAPSFALRWTSDAGEISHDDDLILVAGWRKDDSAACRAARAQTNTPIILVAHKATSRAVIDGLQAGADLVVPANIQPSELQARIRAMIRRNRMSSSADAFRILRFSDSTS